MELYSTKDGLKDRPTAKEFLRKAAARNRSNNSNEDQSQNSKERQIAKSGKKRSRTLKDPNLADASEVQKIADNVFKNKSPFSKNKIIKNGSLAGQKAKPII